jgi:hypothetical protein
MQLSRNIAAADLSASAPPESRAEPDSSLRSNIIININ